MAETVIGICLMLGLFAALLGGMILVTRHDEVDLDEAPAGPVTGRAVERPAGREAETRTHAGAAR